MKKIKIALLCFITTGMLSACSKDFLNKLPEDQLSDIDFWTKSGDLELYVNQFYTMFPSYPDWSGGIFWTDNNSDNMTPGVFDPRLAGNNTIQSGNGNWAYDRIRSVNHGLEHYSQIPEPFESIQGYVGELYFFRAYAYFDLIKAYGDVPWIGHTLQTDSEELMAPRTPRQQVVDSILADLDQAIGNLPEKTLAAPNRLNKACALLFKSRVALYEGTWEKYHANTAFGVAGSDGSTYLTTAAAAANELITGATAQLYNTGNPAADYRNIFNQVDLTSNPEILLWKKYSTALGLYHNSQSYLPSSGGNTGVNKSLVDDYLCIDGLPISKSGAYKGDHNLADVVDGRDPRLAQIIWLPGEAMRIDNNVATRTFSKPSLELAGEYRCTTGYQLKKGASTNPAEGQGASNTSITAAIVFRYAEALLNLAEAKAELGTLTQADLDLSINKLRDRAGMPHLLLSGIAADPHWLFPGLSPLINEVRRERRVELACEGYRLDDLLRWAAAGLIRGQKPLGAIFDPSQFPQLAVGKDIYVNSEGYIDPYQTGLPSGWQFNEGRDYLLPVPQQQITLNPNLAQNPGWE